MTGTLSPVSSRHWLLHPLKIQRCVRSTMKKDKKNNKKERKTHLIFSHIWVFSGPGGFDVAMVKQVLREEALVINIQLPCNSHSSLRGRGPCSSLEVTVGKCRHCLMTELWKSSLGPRELCLHPSCSLNSPHRKQCFLLPFHTEFLHVQCIFQTLVQTNGFQGSRESILSLLCIMCGPCKHFSPLIYTHSLWDTSLHSHAPEEETEVGKFWTYSPGTCFGLNLGHFNQMSG